MFSPFPPWTHLYPTIIFLPPLLPWFLQLLWIVCTLLSKDLELRIAEEREPGLHHSIWWLLIPYIYLQISWFNYSLQINGVYMPHFYLLVEGQLGCFDFLAIVNRECKEFGWAKYLLSPLGICWGVLGHVVLGHVVDLFLTFFFFFEGSFIFISRVAETVCSLTDSECGLPFPYMPMPSSIWFCCCWLLLIFVFQTVIRWNFKVVLISLIDRGIW